ncbi:unnamed protein product [Cuscuta europaea]|uniref:Coiled-coil domain-containing protein SCD2 n=1 Tax=Cuscuta europaea TaxID=41803 RepID=A0A9P1E8C2_CUSEU|nr:unnamed protein product [Cuscuta europaea]
MDRMRPMYAPPQKCTQNTANSEAPSSLGTASPVHHGHSRSGSFSNARKPQNTKAAAQKLAQVMAHQTTDDDDEDDDLLCDPVSVSLSAGVGLAGGRSARNRSTVSIPASMEQSVSLRPVQRRASPSHASSEQKHLSAHPTYATRSSQLSSVDQPPSARSSSANRQSQMSSVEQPSSARSTIQTSQLSSSVEQPPSARSPARSILTNRSLQSSAVEQPSSARSFQAASSFQSTNSVEPMQPLSARSSHLVTTEQPTSARSTLASRPNLGVKVVPIVPSIVPISLRTAVPSTPFELQSESHKDKRLSLDFGTFKHNGLAGQATSALQDELDMLQEQNESLLQKLRLTEERFEESEARARQLEKQVANLGEGVSLDARLLSRKEAALQQREAALKVAPQASGEVGKCEEIESLRAEAETARDEAAFALEKLDQAECEIRSLQNMMKRMALNQDEMEEVVLKRCWLARYWGLCVRYGIQSDIAGAKYEYWSSFAPLPLELLLEAGQKAKVYNDPDEKEKIGPDVGLSTEGCLESMLLVDKGLRELTSLKVEEAVALAIAQQRRPSGMKSSARDDLKLPYEGHEFAETFDLSEEESEDVHVKQAWLLYFWRRAKNQGVETDIAEERLNFWINQGDQPFNSQDAVNVERGLVELKKLGIEMQLWNKSREHLDCETTNKLLKYNDF